jgi:UDP-N-acetylmuramate: L-alanyl-gamma-D-glutamyl-meso-diaminopimelate ligase
VDLDKTLRHVHFVAIAGTGMGSLAGLLEARGIRVTGSDENLYPPMSTALAGWGITPYEHFAAEHVLAGPPDLVVIGNAVGPDNVEARTAIDEGLPYLSFPDALYEHAIAGKHSVVVSGTHGKTTTTSLVASILLATGRDPSLLVGGYAHDFDGSFREAGGDHFVVEGDEYDTAFFDKTPKFLHYGARTLVVTSVEFDHADIYRDLEHVKQEFRKVVAGLPADGTLVAAVNHAGVRDVIEAAPCAVASYGLSDVGNPSWRAVDVTAGPAGTRFGVLADGEPVATVTIPMYGDFNVENALAALVTAVSLGVDVGDAAAALGEFRGIKRRQELRGEERGVAVIDDFAHHPTAVRAAVGGLRARYPERRLVAVFEPRTNTSRRAIFQRDYAESFDAVDHLVVAVVPDAPIYSATGEVTELFSSEDLARDVRARSVAAVALDGVPAIVDHLVGFCEPGDVVLVMSNGGFDDIWRKLLDALRASDARSPQS